MKRHFLPIRGVALMTAALTACQRAELPEQAGSEKNALIQIKADCRVEAWEGFEDVQKDIQDEQTKSLVKIEYESLIHNINVLVFSYGPSGLEYEPERSRYFTETDVRLLLDKSKAYKVYFLANCGPDVLDQASELGEGGKILENLRIEFDNYAGNVSVTGLPMICEREIRPGTESSSILLRFKRLYSRFAIRIDSSELEYSTYKIKSLNLINAPKAIYPLAGASKIRDARDACSDAGADGASRQDITILNRNGMAYLYVLENVQGELLPGNDDCAAKAPWNLIRSGHGDLLENNCLTNLSMQVSADTPWATYDNIALQAYLGGNATSNFSIVRNTAHVLTVKLTADQVVRSEWRIEPDRPVKVYDPRMEVKLETYRDNNSKMWQPRISIACTDCEKIATIAGSFLENTMVRLSISSRHGMYTQFRSLDTWQYMNEDFLKNGGTLDSKPYYVQGQYYSNGSYCEGYYTAYCSLIPPSYVRTCEKYDESQSDGCVFLPGKNDVRTSPDTFHAIINPGVSSAYDLYSEYPDYEGDYNRWVWSYSVEDYLRAQNEVRIWVDVKFPEEIAKVVESVYGKTLEDFTSFSADFHGGCPYSERDLEKLHIDYLMLRVGTTWP